MPAHVIYVPAHVRQSRPDSSLGFHVIVLQIFDAILSSLESGVLCVVRPPPHTAQPHLPNLEFRVEGLRLRRHGIGFRVYGVGFGVVGFRVQGSGFRVQGLGFSVQRLGFMVQGLGFRV